VQGLADALDGALREVAAARAQQPSGRVDQRLDRGALGLGGLAQLRPRALAGEQRLLGRRQRIAGLPQLARGALLRAHGLVGGPRRDGGLGQRLDRRRLLALAVGAQLLGPRVALGDELLARQAVEAVDVVVGRRIHS
jgi:hypothetical protein